MGHKIKVNKFFDELKRINLEGIFTITNENDEGTLIQGQQSLGNGSCLISTVLDERVFNCAYFALGKLTNIRKKENMLELFNEFNNDNLMLKFTITDDNNLRAMISYVATEESFDATDFVAMIIQGFTTIEEQYYGKIMRVMWS